MGQEELVVHGAREHNLKDVTVRLPRNRLICITGLSGSGKSSPRFDTIYAEGQRRYVESLSAYARQFLQMMEKPDVDSIDGLSPAISIDEKTTSRNPRSTVGTVTEIYDYLRLLFARVGRPHCPVCGRPIAGQSLDRDRRSGAPRFRRGPSSPSTRLSSATARASSRTLLRGAARRRVHTREGRRGRRRWSRRKIVLDKKFKHAIEVIVDRLVMKADLPPAARAVDPDRPPGWRKVSSPSTSSTPVSRCSSRRTSRAPDHGVSLPELEPRVLPRRSHSPASPTTSSRSVSVESGRRPYERRTGTSSRCRGCERASTNLEVLHGIDLTVVEHEVVCLIGSTGLGEVDAAPLHRPPRARSTAARSCVDGPTITGPRRGRERGAAPKIGIVFQAYNLFPHLRVLHERHPRRRGKGARGSREPGRGPRLVALLAPSASADKANEFPDRLSGGQQQRVALVGALVTRPEAAAARRDHLGARPAALRRGPGGSSASWPPPA